MVVVGVWSLQAAAHSRTCDDDLSPPQLGGTFRSLPALGVGGFALLDPPNLSLGWEEGLLDLFTNSCLLLSLTSRISLTQG